MFYNKANFVLNNFVFVFLVWHLPLSLLGTWISLSLFFFFLKGIVIIGNTMYEQCVCRGMPSIGIIINGGLISFHNLGY